MGLDHTGPGLVIALGALVLLAIARRLLPAEHRRNGLTATIVLVAALFARVGTALAQRLHASHAELILDFVDDLLLGVGVAGMLDVVLFDTVLHRAGAHAPRILRDILQALTFFGIVIGLLGARGVDVFALATTSAVLTAVVGLALQGTIANLFAGLSMQLDRSFAIGDWIQVGDRLGKIAQIKWRSTSVVTIDGDLLVIPNGQLTTQQVLNYSGPTRPHREWLEISFHYRHPPNEVKRVLVEAIEGAPGVLTSPPPTCVPRKFGDSGVSYALLYWIDDMAREVEIDGEVRTRLWYAAKRAGLEIPYPIQSLIVTHAPAAEHGEPGSASERAERQALLAATELFAPLDAADRELLAERMRRKRFAAGERIIRQGEPGDSVFLVSSGEVAVTLEQDGRAQHVATLGPRELVGEMSLMTGEPRAATCTAKTDVVAYEVDHGAFRLVLEARPGLVDELSRTLGQRVLVLSLEQEQLTADLQAARVAESSSRLRQKIRAFFELR